MTRPHGAGSTRLPEIALLGVAIVWGGTFLATRLALQAGAGPIAFVGWRFGIAAAVTLALGARRMVGLTRIEIVAALAIAAPMIAGYLLQTWGLRDIPSSESAFLTNLYVPAVPLIQLVVLRRPPRLASWIGVALAFAGLVLIARPASGGLSLGPGAWLTLASALAFAGEIILVGVFAARVDPVRIALIDLALVALAAVVAAPLAGEPLTLPHGLPMAMAVGLGVASAGIQLAMTWAQRTVSPTRATLIYASEPVFAGIIGAIAGERLGAAAWAGAALILAGVLASELRPRRWRLNI